MRGDEMTSEYWQFLGALVLFLGILIGSYWFVYAPTRREERSRRDSRSGD